MHIRLAPLALLLLLASCGTPQERCIASATRDTRILDRLIGETELNLTRGYARVEVVRISRRYERCRDSRRASAGGKAGHASRLCLRNHRYTETVSKAINPVEEREKLTEMQKKRTQLAGVAQTGVAQCRQQHPE